MRTYKCALAAASVLLALLMTASSAAAFVPDNQLPFTCGVNSVQAVDPLVDFGVQPTNHSHTQWGASVFTSTETMGQMLGASSTTCDLSTDRTEAWFPTPLRPDGTPATVSDTQWWEANYEGYQLPTTTAGVAAFDPGLRFVAGNHACTQKSCASVIYICLEMGGPQQEYFSIPTAAQCNETNPHGYSAVHYSTHPQCWDGKSLGGGMGASTAANVIGTNIVNGNDGVSCPAGFQLVPGFAFVITVGADGYGGCLASDVADAGAAPGSPCSAVTNAGHSPGASGHFDFVLGLSQADQVIIDKNCLNPMGGTSGAVGVCQMRPATGWGPAGLYAVSTKQLLTTN